MKLLFAVTVSICKKPNLVPPSAGLGCVQLGQVGPFVNCYSLFMSVCLFVCLFFTPCVCMSNSKIHSLPQIHFHTLSLSLFLSSLSLSLFLKQDLSKCPLNVPWETGCPMSQSVLLVASVCACVLGDEIKMDEWMNEWMNKWYIGIERDGATVCHVYGHKVDGQLSGCSCFSNQLGRLRGLTVLFKVICMPMNLHSYARLV